jgi:hypothetical protein
MVAFGKEDRTSRLGHQTGAGQVGQRKEVECQNGGRRAGALSAAAAVNEGALSESRANALLRLIEAGPFAGMALRLQVRSLLKLCHGADHITRKVRFNYADYTIVSRSLH